ncbi:hypothetical protein BDW62DRAFT_182339, partial [Aspergillus aurantiobrunneus]
SYLEASNSNSTSLQPLVHVPRVGPALRPKLIEPTVTYPHIGWTSIKTFASLQYLARVRDRSGREVP